METYGSSVTRILYTKEPSAAQRYQMPLAETSSNHDILRTVLVGS